MLIVISRPVTVRAPSGEFVTVPAGAKVNYSSKRRDGNCWVHTFTTFNPKQRDQIVTHIEAGTERPEWL